MKIKKHYLIHVYQDKDLLIHLSSVHNEAKTAKQASKIMRVMAHSDIIHGRYYYYNIVEQTMRSVEVYPSTETTK
jgi:hypothetical protein